MARAYSLDLLVRVFGAWQRSEGSQHEAAARFGVSERFVRGVVRRQRESGSVAAKVHGGWADRAGHAAAPGDAGSAGRRAQRPHGGRVPRRVGGRRLRAESRHGGALALGPAPDTQKKTLKDDEAGRERVRNLRAAWPAQTAGIKPEDFGCMGEGGVNRALTRR